MMRNTLRELDQFNVGDRIDIYNSITGEVSYSATIESIAPKAYIKVLILWGLGVAIVFAPNFVNLVNDR